MVIKSILTACIFSSVITAAFTAWVVGTLAARRYSKIEELVLENMAEQYEKISLEIMTKKVNQICREHKP